MSLIEECYASGKGTFVDTIEAVPIGSSVSYRYCSGYTDRTCVTEDGRTVTFTALAMDLALPKNDNSGFQNIIIGLDNTTGEVQASIEQAKSLGQRIVITFRRYLLSDLSFPAERYRLTVLSREYEDDIAKLTCGLFDLLNTTGLRNVLTTNLAPGLKYI